MKTTPGYSPLSASTGPPGPEGPEGPPGTPGAGVPTGGAAGNFLLKLSSTAYDTVWGTATDVQTILGLGSAAYVSASSFAAASASLTALGSLTPAADSAPYFTSGSAAGTYTLTTFGRSLMDDADASAARTTLGLGSAAVEPSTAFAASSASLTALGGVTPAADTIGYYTGTTTAGSASLTSAGRTLIAAADAAAQRAALGLGDASTGTVGTAAGNIPQLDSSAVMPNGTIYAASVWTNRWTYTDGSPLASGWTAQGLAMTIAATSVVTNDGTVNCYSLTPNVSGGASYISAAWTAANQSWELYAKVVMPPASTGVSGIRTVISYSPGTTASGNKRLEIGFSSTAMIMWAGTSMVAFVTLPNLTNQMIDLLVQMFQSADGAANSWMRIYVGKLLVYNAPPPSMGATSGLGAGTVTIGRLSSGSEVVPFYLAEIALRTAINPAPADYRFASATWPL